MLTGTFTFFFFFLEMLRISGFTCMNLWMCSLSFLLGDFCSLSPSVICDFLCVP